MSSLEGRTQTVADAPSADSDTDGGTQSRHALKSTTIANATMADFTRVEAEKRALKCRFIAGSSPRLAWMSKGCSEADDFKRDGIR